MCVWCLFCVCIVCVCCAVLFMCAKVSEVDHLPLSSPSCRHEGEERADDPLRYIDRAYIDISIYR
jgi:hypothetical protein